MSFINKSVDYNQTILLKTKILKPILEQYNEYLKKVSCNPNFIVNKNFKIINNHIKYYLFITSKQKLEKCKNDYNILYFFPVDGTVSTDFYMEMDKTFEQDVLFEGYLYNDNDFLTTDVLYVNRICSTDYNTRYATLIEMIRLRNVKLQNINNKISIGIHHILDEEDSILENIFKNNFKYKNELCAMEIVDNMCVKQMYYNKIPAIQKKTLRIEKGNFIDVYNVYDTDTGDFQDVLYVKGLVESKRMKKLFINTNSILLLCEFNKKFNKWSPSSV